SEYISSVMALVDFNTGNTGVWSDCASVTLTAGDWDLTGWYVWRCNSGTCTEIDIGISATSGNSFPDDSYSTNHLLASTVSATVAQSALIANVRKSISTTTTFYMKCQTTFSSGTPKYRGGQLLARR